MVLIVTNSGVVKETLIKFDSEIKDEIIEDLSKLFNNKYVGKSLNIFSKSIDEYIKDEIKFGIDILEKIIEEINKIIFENFIHIEGQNKSLFLPELREDEYMKEYLNIMSNSIDFVEYLNENTEDRKYKYKDSDRKR